MTDAMCGRGDASEASTYNGYLRAAQSSVRRWWGGTDENIQDPLDELVNEHKGIVGFHDGGNSYSVLNRSQPQHLGEMDGSEKDGGLKSEVRLNMQLFNVIFNGRTSRQRQ